MAAKFPPFDYLQILKLRNNNMVKEFTTMIFENQVENTPIQMIEEVGENAM